jgi:Tol biopolymer transport system component
LGWLAAHLVSTKTVSERRLTSNAAELSVVDAAISPDGRYLAFADASGFYLRQIDTGETHALKLPDGINARPRAWLPDAAHILATWVSGPQDTDSIWEISLMGGNPRKLVDRGTWPAVSPDGSSIAYLTARAQFKETYLDKEIWVMRSDGSDPHLLLAGGEDFFGPPA